MVLGKFQCLSVLLIWMTRAYCARSSSGGACLNIFLSPFISLFFLHLSGRQRIRLNSLTSREFFYTSALKKCVCVGVGAGYTGLHLSVIPSVLPSPVRHFVIP